MLRQGVQPPCTARIVVTLSVRFDCVAMLPLVLPVVLLDVFPPGPAVAVAPAPGDAAPGVVLLLLVPVAGASEPTISTH